MILCLLLEKNTITRYAKGSSSCRDSAEGMASSVVGRDAGSAAVSTAHTSIFAPFRAIGCVHPPRPRAPRGAPAAARVCGEGFSRVVVCALPLPARCSTPPEAPARDRATGCHSCASPTHIAAAGRRRFVCNHVDVAVATRGSQHFVTSVVGNAYHTYNVRNPPRRRCRAPPAALDRTVARRRYAESAAGCHWIRIGPLSDRT